jgi:hypothetical protein
MNHKADDTVVQYAHLVGIDLNDRRSISQTLVFFLLTPSQHSLLASLTRWKHKALRNTYVENTRFRRRTISTPDV